MMEKGTKVPFFFLLELSLVLEDWSQVETSSTDQLSEEIRKISYSHTRRCVLDKLSSIIPANARVKSVDMEEAPPARPGAPAFGRKPGNNAIKDKITLRAQAKELAGKEPQLKPQAQLEISRSKMVDEINKKFFDTRLKPAETKTAATEQIAQNVLDFADEAPVTQSKSRDQVGGMQYEAPAIIEPKFSVEA